MEGEHSLLQVVDGRESAGTAYTCAAVEHNLVVYRNVHQLFRVEYVFSTSFAPVMHTQVLNDSADNFVVLFLGSSKIGPSQVL